MKDNILIFNKDFSEQAYEFVERKGWGHPDSLADGLAEELSREYSRYTLEKYGAILHHNFDKVGILGGSSYVKFGEGYLTNPIRVLINGRVSTKFAEEIIPINELLIKWVRNFFSKRLPMINLDKDLDYHFNLSNQSSPGKTSETNSDKGTRKYWFEPRGLFDIQELKKLFANDTSLGVGYAPCSNLELLILKIENHLNSDKYRQLNPWIGSDIKMMGIRLNDHLSITMCIPQISIHVKNVDEYRSNLQKSREDIKTIAKSMKIEDFELNINTRDNYETSELYLTATGSSIESGDEGLVGRGNRINGTIASNKPFSMEGICGKNPVYHIGKIYSLAANQIAKRIFDEYNISSEVYLVSQSGRDLLDPWFSAIVLPSNFEYTKEVYSLVEEELSNIPKLTTGLVEGKYLLY